jgi:hypothetical protein
MDLGYDLFKDRQHLKATLVQADLLKPLLEPVNTNLAKLKGTMDIIFLGSFLHLFHWDIGVTAVKHLVEMGKSKPSTMLLGQQIGSDVAGERIMPEPFPKAYRHSTVSIKQFFEQVGRETGTSWIVEAEASVNDAIIAKRKKGKSTAPQSRGEQYHECEAAASMIYHVIPIESTEVLTDCPEWAKNDPGLSLMTFCATRT